MAAERGRGWRAGMSTRRLRVYALYRAGSRLSCRTATYSHSTDAEVLHVGAYGVRQAYHLAGRRAWGYPLGILERAPRGASWTHYDGTTSHGPRFRHGQSLPRVVAKEFPRPRRQGSGLSFEGAADWRAFYKLLREGRPSNDIRALVRQPLVKPLPVVQRQEMAP